MQSFMSWISMLLRVKTLLNPGKKDKTEREGGMNRPDQQRGPLQSISAAEILFVAFEEKRACAMKRDLQQRWASQTENDAIHVVAQNCRI